MSISSVTERGSQPPTLTSAVLRQAATTPETVMSLPTRRCVRLMRLMTLAYSAVWIFARSVVRLRTRGLPVTAPTRGKWMKCQTAHSMACRSSMLSASSVTMTSPCVIGSAALSAFALPMFCVRRTARSAGYVFMSASITSCVPSVLASLMTMTSRLS